MPSAPAHATTGFYGNSQSASFVEESPAGSDYLAEICTQWEAAAQVSYGGCVVLC